MSCAMRDGSTHAWSYIFPSSVQSLCHLFVVWILCVIPPDRAPNQSIKSLGCHYFFSFCFLSAFPSLSLVFRVFSFQIPILLFVKFVVVCSIWMLFCVVRHLLRVHMTVLNTFRYTSTYVVVKSINLGNLFRPVQKLSAIETLKALESALKV